MDDQGNTLLRHHTVIEFLLVDPERRYCQSTQQGDCDFSTLRRPMLLFLQPLQLLYQLNGHGTRLFDSETTITKEEHYSPLGSVSYE
ncbi:hypothetical protein AVEN_255194-1 [Araneus ventricosus]|uniref:Uncharacterized protein n=1 Tax=Araneus ventricosus TaxID=182803 RepID=A0A4Y2BAI0_ARAVE|nr:hypothetical protein AVEN_255194-1 [Araneus ventricosus]